MEFKPSINTVCICCHIIWTTGLINYELELPHHDCLPLHTTQVLFPELWCWKTARNLFFTEYYVIMKLTFELLDIKCHHFTVLWHTYHINYYVMAKNVFSGVMVTLTLTCDPSNLFTSSLSLSGHFFQVCFQTVSEISRSWGWDAIVTFDLWKSNQFILESERSGSSSPTKVHQDLKHKLLITWAQCIADWRQMCTSVVQLLKAEW